MKITIAGTAGRKDDRNRLDKNIYWKMVSEVSKSINYLNPNRKDIMLVSGGAAWADHIAVTLYLGIPDEYKFNLELYLPAELEEKGYYDSKVFDWKTNPGGTANYYHREFSRKVGFPSIWELNRAKIAGAKIAVYPGFFERNLEMAKSDYAIALTFGENGVKDGGTKHMVDNFLKTHSADKLIHIPIQNL